MDGVDPEFNIQDNLSDVWSSDLEFQAVEALADGFVLGNPTAHALRLSELEETQLVSL